MARKITAKKAERAKELNQLIGDQIRALRKRLDDESGAKFGKRLTPYLGEPWSRQTVWEAEHGQRAFRVDELFALAQATGETVQFFLTAPPKTSEIQLKGGSTLTPADLLDRLRAGAPKRTSGRIQGARLKLKEGMDYLQDALDMLKQHDEWLQAIAEEAKP